MNKINLVIELNGYGKYDLTTLQKLISDIHKKNGKVLLDHFGTGELDIDDMKLLTPDYIKLDKNFISDLLENENKQKYVMELQTLCITKDIDLIAVGVETKELYYKLKRIGVKLMQGYFLASPSYTIDIINDKLLELLNDKSEDSIV